MGAYSKLPTSPFSKISFNAATIASEFNVSTGVLDRSKILFATTGGSQFNPNLSLVDLFEDIDNAKPGTMQGMLIKSCEPHLTTNVLTIDGSTIEKVMPYATKTTLTDSTGVTKVTPNDGIIPESNFFDLWIITDYATMTNTDGSTQPGFFVIHMMNCINVTGFQEQSTKDGKTTFAVDFRAFYDADEEDKVPYEIYFGHGTGTSAS